ncbi:MAG: tryptophan synthase subunit alpha [Candidatus Micrarchaeota archaeon]|nr:tryptophan synthase subunit alpha [Candidatus Micrarchaeota archaeon]
MSLSDAFRKGQCAFMPYVCCGDPSAEFTLKLVKTLVQSGADAIEFGIPFSDPIADGKTIQAASQRALAGGITPGKALFVLAKVRKSGVCVPIAVMTYYNILFSAGLGKMLAKIKRAGADGLIVPDVPLGESAPLRRACRIAGLELVLFATPNSSDARLRKIAAATSGFIYAVSVLGTTGARSNVSPQALQLVKRAKQASAMPLAVGFGISLPSHVRAFRKAGADGVIVGSGIVNIYARHIPGGKINERLALSDVARFAKGMVNICHCKRR